MSDMLQLVVVARYHPTAKEWFNRFPICFRVPCKSRRHATPLRRGDSRFAATKSR